MSFLFLVKKRQCSSQEKTQENTQENARRWKLSSYVRAYNWRSRVHFSVFRAAFVNRMDQMTAHTRKQPSSFPAEQPSQQSSFMSSETYIPFNISRHDSTFRHTRIVLYSRRYARHFCTFF